MNPRRYSGKLFYDQSEHLDVTTFIIRKNEIGISLASVTQEHGRWEAESGKPALLQLDGSYLAQDIHASKNGMPASYPWNIVFRIEQEEMGQYIEVSGELHEAGETYEFEGKLDAVGG